MHNALIKLYFSLRQVLALPRDWLFCLCHGIQYNPSWRFYGLPLIQKRRGSCVTIGARFKACSSPRANSIGVFQKVIVKANAHDSLINIGDDVGMSGCTIAATKSIRIGNRVLIGSGALITDSDAHSLDSIKRAKGEPGISKPIIIGDNVFIGARAIILKGVTLGNGCVVGAGSVVTHDVPAGKIVAGNPARVVGG